MSTRQIVLYALLGGLVLLFLAGAVTSLAATKRKRASMERTGGIVAFAAFALGLPAAVAAVTNDTRVLAAGSVGAVLLIVVMVASLRRCATCGERFSPLTNRQFRQPRCLFCGTPEIR